MSLDSNERRRTRYAQDAEYRRKVLERNRRYKEKQRRKALEKRVRTSTSPTQRWTSELGMFSIGAAAGAIGCSTQTLRQWESDGRVIPLRDENGHRSYSCEQIIELHEEWSLSQRRPKGSRVLSTSSVKLVSSDGRVREELVIRIGFLASLLGRTTMGVRLLESRSRIPGTPLRSPRGGHRLYTIEMALCVRDCLESGRPIEDIKEAWTSLGVYELRVEER